MNLIELTSHNFDDVINQYPIVVLDFWATWCGPCRSFEPIYQAVAAQFPDVCFGRVDVEHEKELAADFNIMSIPTLMILKADRVIFAESGVIPESVLIDLIEQAKRL